MSAPLVNCRNLHSAKHFSFVGKGARSLPLTEAGVTKAALLAALVGTSFGGLGYFCGLKMQSEALPSRTRPDAAAISDVFLPLRGSQFDAGPLAEEIEVIGSPLVEGGAPLWEMRYADLHGAQAQHLGVGMLYYTLAYIQKPATCVLIGSSSGFVPALIRRGQIASGMASGRTFVIDGGYGNDGAQSVHDSESDFRRGLPEVEVLAIPSVPDGVAHFTDRGRSVDYLHIEGNNSFDHEGAYRDLIAYKPLLSKNAVVTIHVTSYTDSAQHSGAYRLVEGLKHDPCWEVLDFNAPESFSLTGIKRQRSQFGAGTAVLKHRCNPTPRQARRTCHADERLMLPDCHSCVPGVAQTKRGVCENDRLMPNAQLLREILTRPEIDWRHLDLLSSPVRGLLVERQLWASRYLQQTRPRRVLDLLSGRLTMENFVSFGSSWCPDLILSVDVALAPTFHKTTCADGAGEVKIIHVAMLAPAALQHPVIRQMAFDAVLCLGCDSDFDGPRAMHLESFARPYDLILEWANEVESNRDDYGRIPTNAKAFTIFEKDWLFMDPTAAGKPDTLQNTSRQFRVVRYPVFS